jgi:hypothetical protein
VSTNGDDIRADIYAYVKNYAVEAFKDLRLQGILLRMLALFDNGGTGGSSTGNVVELTSADFTTTIDCPIPYLDGVPFVLYWNEGTRFLEKDANEWADYPGGGFTVTLTGFDATVQTFHFLAIIK